MNKTLKWSLQFWWILAMTIFIGAIAQYYYTLEGLSLTVIGLIVLIVVFDFFGIRYAIQFYRELKRRGSL